MTLTVWIVPLVITVSFALMWLGWKLNLGYLLIAPPLMNMFLDAEVLSAGPAGIVTGTQGCTATTCTAIALSGTDANVLLMLIAVLTIVQFSFVWFARENGAPK